MDSANAKPSYAYKAAGDHANVRLPAAMLTAWRGEQVAKEVATLHVDACEWTWSSSRPPSREIHLSFVHAARRWSSLRLHDVQAVAPRALYLDVWSVRSGSMLRTRTVRRRTRSVIRGVRVQIQRCIAAVVAPSPR
jgi:hypothetical protein